MHPTDWRVTLFTVTLLFKEQTFLRGLTWWPIGKTEHDQRRIKKNVVTNILYKQMFSTFLSGIVCD